MRTIADQHVTQPRPDNGDGITVFGRDGITVITGCTVDFSAQTLDHIDEALSGVCGARASVCDSAFTGSGKLILWGNGDHPIEDQHATLEMDHCILSRFGRRAPEAQDGARVVLRNCVIRNWGMKDRFDTRAFGAWAHDGAHIEAVNCVFEQTSFWQTGFWNFWKDLAHHLGHAINRRGILDLTWRDFIPGVCRGLTASDGGTVRAINCRKNKWWIRIEGQEP